MILQKQLRVKILRKLRLNVRVNHAGSSQFDASVFMAPLQKLSPHYPSGKNKHHG